jgi:hypothetical protein
MGSTLLELRQEVLVYLNDIGELNTATPSRYSVPALNLCINKSIHYYERQLNQFYQGYLSETISVDLLASTKSYALGSAFRSPVYEVRRTISNFDYYLDAFIPYYQVMSDEAVPNESWLPTYTLEGNSIVFAYPPVSNETAGVRVKSQKKLVELSADGDELDDQLCDAESCIAIRAAMRALRAKDVSGAFKNIDGWGEELKQEEASFMTQVGNRYVKPSRPIPCNYDYDSILY